MQISLQFDEFVLDQKSFAILIHEKNEDWENYSDGFLWELLDYEG